MNTPTAFWQVHAPTCYQVRGMASTTREQARQREPDSWAHSCLNLGPAAQPVVLTLVPVEPHPYTPGMAWSPGAPRALCRVCHSADKHKEDRA